MHIRESKIHNGSSTVYRWNLLYDLEFLIPIIMLWEVDQESRATIVYGYVDTWQLV